ncbi:cellulase-6, endo-1,4-beta-glucanase [Phytophthora sojae]|uniref:Cellulase-6, endo-1,4-beta-glucanase n=2 Tax=Phytophthora sojae TaxID=67593 RepID=G4ZB57_PHYSP|nr:cellulase-6, endo-1,4-beta-glucanase [Phytophthora sojae]ABC87092.1 cell 5A endo-1,4-betaglucanase [Phytophthora sojae]EGZ22023.1 cellulase-6, endo-1,4-beta-glucanase [Phytophthora sojae]|eukprot:XP_009524740.1 cellulase-6, endo-1,4-beta-glucanase [Phytophthora sojae]
MIKSSSRTAKSATQNLTRTWAASSPTTRARTVRSSPYPRTARKFQWVSRASTGSEWKQAWPSPSVYGKTCTTALWCMKSLRSCLATISTASAFQSIKNILKNTAPQKTLINANTNRAINITSYISTLQTIVEALGYHHITAMISLHTLDPTKSGGAWYDEDSGVSEDDFLEAVDILTKNLCDSKYWNILGLDLKNEPHECSGGGRAPDWQKGATLIGNRMLDGCPNWLAFVEGVNGIHSVTVSDGRTNEYYDWWRGALEEAGDDLIEYNVENKLVWAPHYYSTGVSPQWYLYAAGEWQESGIVQGYEELGDEELKANVDITMDVMFGYLMNKTLYAMVLGEFAGLYSKDAHPKLTTKRTTDYNIEGMVERGYAGGYMWSLNPESAYQYNPADTAGDFTEGLLEDDWLTPNKRFLEGMAAMDKIKDLRRFPCFPVELEEEDD